MELKFGRLLIIRWTIATKFAVMNCTKNVIGLKHFIGISQSSPNYTESNDLLRVIGCVYSSYTSVTEQAK